MPTSRDVLDFVFDDDNNRLNVNVASMPVNSTSSGTIDALSESVSITTPNGCATVGMQITGTWVGQLDFQGTVDGTNWIPVEASNGSATINATAGNDIFVLPGAAYLKIRAVATAWTSGTATVTFIASIGAASNIITSSLPAGTNNIGDVDVLSIAAGSNTIGGTTDAGTGYTTTLTYTASADATSPTAITAAPTAGQKIVVDDIVISTDTAMAVEFELEDTVATNYMKLYLPANGTAAVTPRGKWKLGTADKKLMIDASVAGNIAVTCIYHSEA